MKKILTAVFVLTLFAGASQAQTAAPEKDPPRGHRKGMMKDLNLTDPQKTQLKNIREAEKNDLSALKSQGSVTQEQRKAVREKYRSQLEAVLTPEQREQMKTKMKEHSVDGAGNGGRRFDKKRADLGGTALFMNKDLNLTADQQTKLKGYADDFHTKARGIRGNDGLTDEQKKEQMRTLADNYREQRKAVLTPEQLQKMNEGRGKRKGKGAANV